jgi:hypothetical protein
MRRRRYMGRAFYFQGLETNVKAVLFKPSKSCGILRPRWDGAKKTQHGCVWRQRRWFRKLSRWLIAGGPIASQSQLDQRERFGRNPHVGKAFDQWCPAEPGPERGRRFDMAEQFQSQGQGPGNRSACRPSSQSLGCWRPTKAVETYRTLIACDSD